MYAGSSGSNTALQLTRAESLGAHPSSSTGRVRRRRVHSSATAACRDSGHREWSTHATRVPCPRGSPGRPDHPPAGQAGGLHRARARTLTAVHGPWVVVRRGVYCERTLWDSLTGYGERAGLRDRAVHLTMRTEHLMSHDSAARALGIPMLKPRRELSHVTREGLGGTRTEHGVKHHLTRLGLLNTEVVEGMRVTGPARTALDLAREHGRDAGVVACDAVRHRGLPREALDSELLLMWCWPGVTQAKRPSRCPTRERRRRARRCCDCSCSSSASAWPPHCVPRAAAQLGRVGRPPRRLSLLRVRRQAEVPPTLARRRGSPTRGRRSSGTNGSASSPCAPQGLGMSRVSWDELFGPGLGSGLKRRLLAEYAVTADPVRRRTAAPPGRSGSAACAGEQRRRPQWDPRRAG